MIFAKNISKIHLEKSHHEAISYILSSNPEDLCTVYSEKNFKDKEKLKIHEKLIDFEKAIIVQYGKTENDSLQYLINKAKDLRHFESYRGRIDYSHYLKLFNFEQFIYRDKLLSYNNFKQKNIEVVADFASSCLTKYICDDFVSKDIRKHIEGYFLAIMSNLEYKLYANDKVFDETARTSLFSLHLIMGVTPSHFEDPNIVIEERVKLYKTSTKNISQPVHFVGTKKVIDNFTNSSQFIKIPIHEENVKGKMTRKGIQAFFEHIASDYTIPYGISTNKWELNIYTSSFHVIRCAIEIEQYIHDFETSQATQRIEHCFKNLESIKIITECKIFDLVTNRSDKIIIQNREEKLKAMLFELYYHCLDKNAH